MKSYSVYFANYTIGEDAYENVPQVCGHYGKRILLIGGEKAMEAGLGILEKAIQGTELEIVDKVVFGEDCTPGTIKRWADHARECEADMILEWAAERPWILQKEQQTRQAFRSLLFPQ